MLLDTGKVMVEARIPSPLPELLPSQRTGLAELEQLSDLVPIVFLNGESGSGKTGVLRHFAERNGGCFVDAVQIMPVAMRTQPEACDGAIMAHLKALADKHPLLVIDDLEMVGPTWRVSAERSLMAEFFQHCCDIGTRLVIGHSWWAGGFLEYTAQRVRWAGIPQLGAEDFQAYLMHAMPATALERVDCDLVIRHAGQFDLYTLHRLVRRLEGQPALTTQSVAATLLELKGGGNVNLAEVETLEFASLPGTDHIASALETHVVLPLEHGDLARRLNIRPKRGVLLYGPPGSGKTSVGRALAHRMKGKFFLIDGSIATEPPADFFAAVQSIVEDAKRNAPAVLFIDDADVLFGIVHISGLSRYLLTLLDGMESESAAKVCVMMTAMNANKIPTPILRSGRVELWLATTAPDATVRGQILRRWLGEGLPGHDDVDFQALAALGEGCTPADLRRVVGDAHSLYAADSLGGRETGRAQDYLHRAMTELVTMRDRMARHFRDDSLRIGSPRASTKYGAGIGGLVESATSCALMKW